MIIGGCVGLGAVAIGVCASSIFCGRSLGRGELARWAKTASIVALLIAGLSLSVYALVVIHQSSFCDPSNRRANVVVRWLLAEIFPAFIFFCLITAISPLLPQDKAADL